MPAFCLLPPPSHQHRFCALPPASGPLLSVLLLQDTARVRT
jgi:hypothetical protein